MSLNNFLNESQLNQIVKEELQKYQQQKLMSRVQAWLRRKNIDFDSWLDANGYRDNKGTIDHEAVSKWYREQTSTVPIDEKKKKKRKGGKRDGKGASSKGYSLRDWFKGGGWVQTGGKYDGKPCAKQPGQKTKPYCRDPDDRAKLSKKDRDKRARKKRKEDPNPERRGKAKNVSQKKRGKKK